MKPSEKEVGAIKAVKEDECRDVPADIIEEIEIEELTIDGICGVY